MDNVDIILKTLKDSAEPLRSSEIAELAQIDKKEADKAINYSG